LKKKTVTVIEIMGISFLFVAFALFFVFGGSYFGFDPTFTTSFISVSPYLLIFSISMVVIVIVRGLLELPACFFAGVGLSLLIGQLNVLGLVTASLLGDLTIVQLQLWIILILTMLGGVLAALTRDH